MSTTDDIAEILKNRKLDALKGLRENQWFDAKRAAGYNLVIAAGRFELAKDVSALANAEGGHILVGLTTIDLPTSRLRRLTDWICCRVAHSTP